MRQRLPSEVRLGNCHDPTITVKSCPLVASIVRQNGAWTGQKSDIAVRDLIFAASRSQTAQSLVKGYSRKSSSEVSGLSTWPMPDFTHHEVESIAGFGHLLWP